MRAQPRQQQQPEPRPELHPAPLPALLPTPSPGLDTPWIRHSLQSSSLHTCTDTTPCIKPTSNYPLCPRPSVKLPFVPLSPCCAPAAPQQRLRALAKAADAISLGDLVSTAVRRGQNFSLWPVQAAVGTLLPATYMRGSRETFGLYPNEMNFPRWGPGGGGGRMQQHGADMLGQWRRMCYFRRCRADAFTRVTFTPSVHFESPGQLSPHGAVPVTRVPYPLDPLLSPLAN